MEKKDARWHESCSDAYPNQPMIVARFSLIAGWLEECWECTGKVFVSDSRDVFFQGDPFDNVSSNDIVLFSEHPAMTTLHWLEQPMMSHCYHLQLGPQPVINSGTIMGTKIAIVHLFREMGREYEKLRRQCKSEGIFDGIGVDQPLLNSMYYRGDIKNAEVLKYREGPVMTVGFPSSIFLKKYEDSNFTLPDHRTCYKETLMTDLSKSSVEVSNDTNLTAWQIQDFVRLQPDLFAKVLKLVNGWDFAFMNNDGKPAAVVHQYDRFGVPFFWDANQGASGVWMKPIVGEDSFSASSECTAKKNTNSL